MQCTDIRLVFYIATARAITMANLRQKIELALILLFTLIGFASYHPETGSTAWLQWLTLVILLFFTYTFDASFTDQSSFIFDPDAVSAALSLSISLSLSRRSGRPAGALRDVPPCRSSPLSHHFLRECMPPPPLSLSRSCRTGQLEEKDRGRSALVATAVVATLLASSYVVDSSTHSKKMLYQKKKGKKLLAQTDVEIIPILLLPRDGR